MDVQVAVVAEGVHIGYVFLDVVGGLGFCMELLKCLGEHALDICVGIDFDMLVHKRVF